MANLRVDKITSTETFETTGSVQFDGTGDYLDVTESNNDFDFDGDFTIEFWVYFNTVNARNDTVGSANNSVYLGASKSGWIASYYTLGGNKWHFSYQSNEAWIFEHTFSFTSESSRWYHVAFTREDSSIKCFVDGVQQGATKTSSTTLTSTENSVRVGGGEGSTSLLLNGFVSNLRIIKGKALYTANFKPPMRELEVTPETVLLACQSKTDTTLEKIGKVITANGNAVASELTPGILTPVPKAGAGSAITGSVEFDGTGDYLSLADSSDWHYGSGDFTAECWVQPNASPSQPMLVGQWSGSTGGTTLSWVMMLSNDSNRYLRGLISSNTSAVDFDLVSSASLVLQQWNHCAFVKNGSTFTLYLNGINVASTTDSDSLSNATNALTIGATSSGAQPFQGFISNVRVIKGTALYTDDFIPPTRELKKVPGTVLLCCQDEDSVTTEATGKTITSNGDPAASNFTPQVGDDRKVTFEGVTKINSDAYFYLPTGDTASKEATGTYNAGTRGVMMGGIVAGGSTKNATIDYWTMASTGDAIDFGDCTGDSGSGAGVASRVRGVNPGGFSRDTTNFDYVTIMSTGNALDFGDLPSTRNTSSDGGFSSETRGVFHQGLSTGPTTYHDIIDYITIATTGNALDFGDTTYDRHNSGAVGSPTRGVWAGGYTPSNVNSMDYVTIASTGNANDFGDLSTVLIRAGGSSNATRGVFLGGQSPALTNSMSYITIATTGNGQDFGDLIQAQEFPSGTSSSTRGVKVGGNDNSPGPYAPVGTIEYFEIATTGNTQAFGDLSVARARGGTFSNGHGGLG